MAAKEPKPLPQLQADRYAVGLFDCCAAPGGCGRCAYVTFCGPCAIGELAGKLPPQSACFAGNCCAAGWAYCGLQIAAGFVGGLPIWLLQHYQYRQNIRRQFGMTTPYGFEDAVALCFCEGCSLCQELNEVDLRAIAAAQQQVSGEAGVTYIVAPEQPKM